ncbi:hypothetical protein [Pontimicrobium sp. MEBiC06410]
MKQNIVKTLLLLTLTVILFNCEKEDKLTVEDNSNNIKKTFNVSKINTAAIFSNSNVKNKLETISKTVNKQTQNKEVMSSEHGFTINTEQATYIENTATNYHSYTFPIQRPIETEYLENLVLSLQNNGTYKIALTKYNITAQEKQLILNEGAVNLKDKITITYIEDENLISNLLNKATTTEQCLVYDYSYGACDNGDTYIHGPQPFANGGMCTGSTQTIIGASYDMDCLDGISMDNGSPGSGTDSTNTGTSTNNQTDNGGADPTHIVVTAPIVLQPWQQVVSCLNTISETGSNGFTPEMATWLQAQPKGIVNQINIFLQENSCSDSTKQFTINAINSIINQETSSFEEYFTIENINPDCESFNYSQVGSTVWQCAAVSNIHELFLILNINCTGFDWGIFTQPLYFQLPVNTQFPLSSGVTQTQSAVLLQLGFEAFDNWYQENGCNTTSTAMEQTLLDYIKDEFEYYGGNVTLTPPLGFSGTPSPYKTSWFGYGDCL